MMQRFFVLTISFLFWLNGLLAQTSFAFLLPSKNGGYIGLNNDQLNALPGLIITNPRGIIKQNVTWDQLNGSDPQTSQFTWTSKYGSVTFTYLGKEFPAYGLNEQGLFVAELPLYNTQTTDDTTRFRLFFAQWIQQQLDQYATIAEVTAAIKNSPIPQWGPYFKANHFFIADATGRTAAIAFLQNEIIVATDSTMPINALGNNLYHNDLLLFNEQTAAPDYSKKNSSTRFYKAGLTLAQWQEQTLQAPADSVWKLVDLLAITPQWQLVIDLSKREIQYKSSKETHIKKFLLSDFDFASKAKSLCLDIHQPVSWPASVAFLQWTPLQNLNLLQQTIPLIVDTTLTNKQLLIKRLNYYGVLFDPKRK